jgi:uncharacterized protein (DUF488 family)
MIGSAMGAEPEPGAQPFFTIGHSTRPIAEFVALLSEAGVRLVIDVRSVPRSRTNPQYNRDALPGALASFQIGYEHLPALGGLRGASRTVAAAVNGAWTNPSFHHYADHALTDAFRSGFAALLALGHERRCAIMCSEAVWWRCHRRIIADYLLDAGEATFHILRAGVVPRARLTPEARRTPEGTLVYPAGA